METQNSTIETEAYEAGRRFRRVGRDRALAWFDSQSNTIGYPYLDSSTYARVRSAFLRGAGSRSGR